MSVRLTLFDLDHTLLAGDSDVLWCDFLLDRGLLGPQFRQRNERMEHDYRAGTVSAQAFCEFYVSTLTGRSREQWDPVRRDFLAEVIAPRIPPAAHALVARHRDAGDLLVMTTATNRYITELTAAHLGLPHLIATECELDDAGNFTGRTAGTLNMRQGKVQRLHVWLAAQQLSLAQCESTLYSDSINDLPLLSAVNRPVAVDPDPQLAVQAGERGWAVISLHGGNAA